MNVIRFHGLRGVNRPGDFGGRVLINVVALVESMDGSMGVISTPGQGSTFHFTVNLARP